MLILISPAKTMKQEKIHKPTQVPVLLSHTKIIHEVLKHYQQKELMELMHINEKIALQTLTNFQNMRFDIHGISALDAYDGLQFKAMRLHENNESIWKYLDHHLRILSGFYGVLKPSDSIYPYRLEMLTNLEVMKSKHLYAFWKDMLAEELKKENQKQREPYFVNLASKEYTKSIKPYIDSKYWIEIDFYMLKDGKLKMHSTQAKSARGMMVRFLADHQIEQLDAIKHFQEDGYQFHKEASDATHFIFVKKGN